MSKRHKMDRRRSEKQFSRTAGNQHVHYKNNLSTIPGPGIMRGGIRL